MPSKRTTTCRKSSPTSTSPKRSWPRSRVDPGIVRIAIESRDREFALRLASCSCGRLRAEVRGEPLRISICHCYACQRRTGSVFAAQARFSRENVKIEGEGSEYVRVGDEGGAFRFSFCSNCGSTLFYFEDGNEDLIAIPVGAFADSDFPEPTFSVYEERKHSWVSLPEDMEHMD